VPQQTKAIHIAVREARRAKGLTQSQLADHVGCKQSAISMFEGGRTDVLSADTISRVAKELAIDMQSVAEPDPRRMPSEPWVLKYCPVDSCPSNIPYAIGEQVLFRPSTLRAPAAETTRCPDCGELLESSCSHCQANLREGACCCSCGTPFVTAVHPTPPAVQEWADRQRQRIRELRDMSRTQPHEDPHTELTKSNGDDER